MNAPHPILPSNLENELYLVAFRTLDAGIILTDDQGKVLFIDELAKQLTGYSTDMLTGVDFCPMLPKTEKTKKEWSFPLPDGSRRYLECSMTSTPYGKLYVVYDISAQKELIEESCRLAFYDPLTNLPNRRFLLRKLSQTVLESKKNNLFYSLIFFSITNFDLFINTLGNPFGDIILMRLANRLRYLTSDKEDLKITIGRFDGAQFYMLWEEIDSDNQKAEHWIKSAIRKLQSVIHAPITVGSTEVTLSINVGATLFRGQSVKTDELLRRANIALIYAQKTGRDHMVFFKPEMEKELIRRALLEKLIDEALAKGYFRIYYQPQVDNKGLIIGAEALIRLNHPEHGIVSPGEFVAIAEETGQIVPVGRWVLKSACRHLRMWQDRFRNPPKIAVNVSARQFLFPGFVETLEHTIEKSGVDPSFLKIELTESIMLYNSGAIIEIIEKLKRHGITFAIDDFGTGYSSLSYLKTLPVDQIKIDQSFVRNIPSDIHSVAIIKAILAIANHLGFSTLAEGVENKKQLSFLKSEGCQQFQGYLFGKAMARREFEVLFAQNRKLSL